MKQRKWMMCALGILSFVALSAGSCDEDNDVDCDEESGAWVKCEDGKLKQCYKGELSGDYIYKSEKCESGECASETACLIEETDGGITPAPTDGGIIEPEDGGIEPEPELPPCTEQNMMEHFCVQARLPDGTMGTVLKKCMDVGSTEYITIETCTTKKCNMYGTDCAAVEGEGCTLANIGRRFCVDVVQDDGSTKHVMEDCARSFDNNGNPIPDPVRFGEECEECSEDRSACKREE